MKAYLLASAGFLAGCGGHVPPEAKPRAATSIERFVSGLVHGSSLYGLGRGCDEWRATPGEQGIRLEVDDDATAESQDELQAQIEAEVEAEGESADEPADEPQPRPVANPRRPEGRLRAVTSVDGRIYGFSYFMDLDKDSGRIKISGRGSWSPAPGVMIRSATDPSMFVIGVGSYCISEVALRSHPTVADAVYVGDEIWYLTQSACSASEQRASTQVARGCGKKQPSKDR